MTSITKKSMTIVFALTLGIATCPHILHAMEPGHAAGAPAQAAATLPPIPNPQDPEEIATVGAGRRLEEGVRALHATLSAHKRRVAARSILLSAIADPQAAVPLLEGFDIPANHPGLTAIPRLLELADQNRAEIAAMRARHQEHSSRWHLDIVEQHGFLIHLGIAAKVPVMADFLNLVIDNLQKFGLSLQDWRRLMDSCGGPAKNNSLWTMLHCATSTSNQALVEHLLGLGADVNSRCAPGITPLHVADTANIARLLVNNGAQFSKDDRALASPLHTTRGPDVVKYYVEELHQDVDQLDGNGLTALHYAVFFGQVKRIKGLLAVGANPSPTIRNATNPKSSAALAIQYGKNTHAILTELLNAGVDVNAPDAQGNTLLHYVATAVVNAETRAINAHQPMPEDPWHLSVARLLLDRGANPQLRNLANQTPRQILNMPVAVPGAPAPQRAGRALSHFLAQMLEEAEQRFTSIPGAEVAPALPPITVRLPPRTQQAAAARAALPAPMPGQPHMTTVLAQQLQPQPPAQQLTPQQLLLEAIQKNDPDEVKAALTAGAQATNTDEWGQPLLHYAIRCNSGAKVIQHLIDTGARVDQMYNGTSVLSLATTINAPRALRALLDIQVDPNVTRSSDGATPLHEASHNGKLDAVRILIEYHANLEAITRNGETPLHQAARAAHADVVAALLEAGANVHGGRTDGWTPLRSASESTNPCYLQKYGTKRYREQQHAETIEKMNRIVTTLLRHGAHVTPEIIAAAQSEIKPMLEIYNFGLMAGRQTHQYAGSTGTSPLHAAATYQGVLIKQEGEHDAQSHMPRPAEPMALSTTPLHAAAAAQPAALLAAALSAQAAHSRPSSGQGDAPTAKRARTTPSTQRGVAPQTEDRTASGAHASDTPQQPASVIDEAVFASGVIRLQPDTTPTTPPQPQASSGATALLARFAQRDAARFSGAKQ